MGVIDSLQVGFNTVARRIWLLVVPVALDIYFWLGPRLSIAGLVHRIAQGLAIPAEADPMVTDYLKGVQESLEGIGEDFNLFFLLKQEILGMPSLMSGQAGKEATAGWANPVIDLDSALVVGLAMVLISLLGLLLGCFYLDLLAGQVRREDPAFSARRLFSFWGLMILLGLIVLAALTVFALTQGVTIAVASVISSVLGALLTVFWLGVMLLGTVGLFFAIFTVDAVVINQVGVLTGVRNSYEVVRRNLWASLGFFLLVNLIGWGMPIVWRRISVNALSTLLGIAGNAFIGPDLVTASLIFYRDRYELWQARRHLA